MQTFAIHDAGICLSVARLRCAKTAEWIDVLFGVESLVDSKNIVLDGSPPHPQRRGGGLMRSLSHYFGHLQCDFHFSLFFNFCFCFSAAEYA